MTRLSFEDCVGHACAAQVSREWARSLRARPHTSMYDIREGERNARYHEQQIREEADLCIADAAAREDFDARR